MGIRRRFSDEFKTQVVLEILKEEKTLAQLASNYEISSTQLIRWRDQAIQSLRSAFSDERKAQNALKDQYEAKIADLYSEIGRLTTQVTWLKKNPDSNWTKSERRFMVDWDYPDLSIVSQAELLGINRTSLYYKPVEPSLEEVRIKHRIDEIYTKWPFYGSRRIAEIMKRDTVDPILINRKAVQKHMREMGISAIYPGPNLSKRRLKEQVYPYLLRGIKITQPNQVWGTDITYSAPITGY